MGPSRNSVSEVQVVGLFDCTLIQLWVSILPTNCTIYSSSPCVQTGSGAHPAFYPMGTGVLSPGKARPGRDADHLPPSSVKNE
jgi:hypothetical protein